MHRCLNSRRCSILVEPSVWIDQSDCGEYWPGKQTGSRWFRSHSRSLHGSRKNVHHDHPHPHTLSLSETDPYSPSASPLSIEHREQVSRIDTHRHSCPLSSSWKHEFRQWIGDLEPQIHVYLFSADDVAKHDRASFLRRVGPSRSDEARVSTRWFSGMTTGAFWSWVTKCTVYWTSPRIPRSRRLVVNQRRSPRQRTAVTTSVRAIVMPAGGRRTPERKLIQHWSKNTVRHSASSAATPTCSFRKVSACAWSRSDCLWWRSYDVSNDLTLIHRWTVSSAR